MKYVRSKYSVEERIKLCLSKYVLSYQGKNVKKKFLDRFQIIKKVFDI